MPLLAFKPRWTDAVRNGAALAERDRIANGLELIPRLPAPHVQLPGPDDPIKRQTIRARRRDGHDPKRGETLYLWTRLRHRTLPAIKLGEVVCLSSEPIRIWPSSRTMEYQGRQVGPALRNEIARRDGFADFEDMRPWLFEDHGSTLDGFVIRW